MTPSSEKKNSLQLLYHDNTRTQTPSLKGIFSKVDEIRLRD